MLPENIARKKSGTAQTQAEREEDEEAQPGAAHTCHPGEQTQYERSQTRGSYDAEAQAHEQRTEVSGVRLGCCACKALGKLQLPESEETCGEENQNTGNNHQHDGILKCRSHQTSRKSRHYPQD